LTVKKFFPDDCQKDLAHKKEKRGLCGSKNIPRNTQKSIAKTLFSLPWQHHGKPFCKKNHHFNKKNFIFYFSYFQAVEYFFEQFLKILAKMILRFKKSFLLLHPELMMKN
jgi:hypothetical protein